MAADSNQLQQLQQAAESLLEVALLCPVGARPAQQSLSQSESQTPQHTLADLYHGREWLRHQLRQHKAALLAAKCINPPSSNDIEKLQENISKLQEELRNETADKALRDLMIKRMHQGNSLCRSIFPSVPAGGDGHASQLQQKQKITIKLLEKQTELASEILRIHKLISTIKPGLETLRKDNFATMKHNREIMQSIKELKAGSTPKTASPQVKRSRTNLELAVSRVENIRHTLQGLILGSGINWAQDEHITELLIGLGQPLDSQLE